MVKIYDERPSGVFEIQNWANRKNSDDVMLGRILDPLESLKFRNLKESGHSDSHIWRSLHPQPNPRPQLPIHQPKKKIQVSCDFFTKEQLIKLVEQASGKPLPSMNRMNKKDILTIMSEVLKSCEFEIDGSSCSPSA